MTTNAQVQADAAQAIRREKDVDDDPRVYVNLPQLVRLQHRVRGMSFLPRQPIHSLLSGRHASRIRGRGLNFEELRAYHAGDDIRTIDWKVTARTRTPHSRVYTEERDRAAYVLLDQRVSMFFGTQVNMKSVTAAVAAAVAAWRVVDSGDRIGAIVFNDSRIEEIAPQRSRQTVMRILRTIVRFNRALNADQRSTDPDMLNRVVAAVSRHVPHDGLVVLLSDFYGYDRTTHKQLLSLSQHNDAIMGLVHDPSASKIPESRHFVISDGDLQVELPLQSGRARRDIAAAATGRIAELLDIQKKLPIPVLPLSTAEDVVRQLQRLLGQLHSRGARR